MANPTTFDVNLLDALHWNQEEISIFYHHMCTKYYNERFTNEMSQGLSIYQKKISMHEMLFQFARVTMHS